MGCTSSKELQSSRQVESTAMASLSDSSAPKSSIIKKVDNIEEILELSQRNAQAVKLLLLGAGECGKSTVLKQMRLIHTGGFTPIERLQYTRVIWSDTIQSMKILVENASRLNISLDADSDNNSSLHMSKELVLNASLYDKYEDDDEDIDNALREFILDMHQKKASKTILREEEQYNDDISGEELEQAKRDEAALHAKPKTRQDRQELAEAIYRLWKNDKGIYQCYLQANKFQLEVNAKEYFENVFKFVDRKYLASDQDILIGRIKTTGISETVFNIRNTKFRMFDVGGQRSERKKWIHCFDNVTAVLYVVAVSEYDEKLYEDESIDRKVESIKLFADTINSPYFTNTPIILFLNKIDILKRKLKTSPIKNYYPGYSGDPYSVQQICDFIKNIYISQNLNQSRQIYVHNTCATDTESMKFVMSAVTDMVFQRNILWSGLI